MDTQLTLTPRTITHYSQTLKRNMTLVDMVEVANAFEPDYPQALIHIETFNGEIADRLKSGKSVRVRLVDVDAEEDDDETF